MLANKLSQIDWDFPNSETTENINSIHPYPAKFIQEIPRTLIQTVGIPKGTWVMDPFCGAGATLVESQLAGIPAIGIDVNPIACLISRVKTQPLAVGVLNQAKEAVEKAKRVNRDIIIPNIPNLDHWFRKDLQKAITCLLVQIEGIEVNGAKDALRLALSSILVRVSNQESDTRYAAIPKNIDADRFYALFLSSVERLIALKQVHRPKTWEVNIICKDIMKVTSLEIQYPIGLVVTSPPYPNAYEYWLYHKYRMYWLGYDPIQVKKQEIGARAHYFKKNYPTEKDFRQQMRNVLELLWQLVVRRGHVCIVIGRSKIHGRIIDNASIIAQIATDLGFQQIANLTRLIASSRKTFNLSHANIKRENLLVFRRN
jgi:site-specific DNA-methyltransferase (cytosine-N4-specific)